MNRTQPRFLMIVKQVNIEKGATIRRSPSTYRFSVRGLLIATAILAVWLGIQTNHIRRQKAVVQWVIENGGQVTYDWQFGENGRRSETAEPPGPAWLRDYLGNGFFQRVESVTLHETKVVDVSLLAKLTHLKWLHLGGSPVADLAPLARLKHLRRLGIGSTQVSDLTPLAGMSRLTTLYLMKSDVTDLSPLAGLSALETINLTDTEVTDLSPLMSCSNLVAVLVPNGIVADEEVQRLQKALPNCIVR